MSRVKEYNKMIENKGEKSDNNKEKQMNK